MIDYWGREKYAELQSSEKYGAAMYFVFVTVSSTVRAHDGCASRMPFCHILVKVLREALLRWEAFKKKRTPGASHSTPIH